MAERQTGSLRNGINSSLLPYSAYNATGRADGIFLSGDAVVVPQGVCSSSCHLVVVGDYTEHEVSEESLCCAQVRLMIPVWLSDSDLMLT
jgi:hypothetical protein